jgi:hypothetical protein
MSKKKKNVWTVDISLKKKRKKKKKDTYSTIILLIGIYLFREKYKKSSSNYLSFTIYPPNVQKIIK